MNHSRNIYLQTVPIQEALQILKSNLSRENFLQKERVKTEEAFNRITAAPVFARYSSPTYHSAAMDGIAVNAADTFGAREGRSVQLQLEEHFIWINTGEPLPADKNAVIMIENIHQLDESRVEIEYPAFPWQHVRRIGEDIVATELLFPQSKRLNAYDIGALLSAGIWEVEVWKKLHVYIIPTGNEVLDFTQRPSPQPGQVIESNSQVLRLLAEEIGAEVTRIPPVPDDEQLLSQAVQTALNSPAHIIILGAGSSAGSRDYSRMVMQKFGEVLVHGIAAMPGKPSILGIASGKLLVGAPGYPVSSIVCFEQLLRPLMAWVHNRRPMARKTLPVQLTRKVPSKLGQDEFLRLGVGKVRDNWIGIPLARGAGMITSLTRAQGVAKIPLDSEGVEEGKTVAAELIAPEEEINQNLICIGSHDNTLDLLKNELMGLENPVSLVSTHVGSMGGIRALKNGTTHISGCHLFDPQSQDFNFPFIQKYLKDMDLMVINLAIRHQGLMVPRGNPRNIQGVADLARSDIRFINRQRGSGTRILLDDLLQKNGITAEQVNGYAQEEYTHMAVAVNVLSKTADCGLGIFAAAMALDLDFVPLCKERYDLLIPVDLEQDGKIRALVDLLQSDNLHRKIKELGGFETQLTGKYMQPGMGLGN